MYAQLLGKEFKCIYVFLCICHTKQFLKKCFGFPETYFLCFFLYLKMKEYWWCEFLQTEYWIGLKIININDYGFKKFWRISQGVFRPPKNLLNSIEFTGPGGAQPPSPPIRQRTMPMQNYSPLLLVFELEKYVFYV